LVKGVAPVASNGFFLFTGFSTVGVALASSTFSGLNATTAAIAVAHGVYNLVFTWAAAEMQRL